jgi:RNA polymerase sigma-54 factor
MEIKQQIKLSQQLVMTPQLQQAIRLLQLSRLELIDEIRKELDANPVLADDEIDPRPRDNTDRSSPSPLGSERPVEERIGETERLERDVDMNQRAQEKKAQEVDWEQWLENRTLQQPMPVSRGGFEDLPPIEQNLTRPLNLQEHLMWQLQMSDFSEEERRFAELVIGNLDEKGYLDLKGIEREDGTRTPDLTIEDLAREAGLNPDDAPDVLHLMQEFDPIGVCARNLQECLRVQAEAFGFDELEMAIVDRHLHNLEKHNYQAIARDMKVPVEEIYEAAQEIQKLESRPARNFSDTDDKTIAITPDVYVIKDGDRFVVLDNDRGVQRLYINEALTKQMLRDPHAKEFIGEKLRNAQWLIRAIEQRRKTIIRVTECIVEKQREFFEKGVAYLRPMILRDVAETVGMHESTISRVTTNKYVHTPQGLFELKYFFNSSIRRVADEDIASESVKQAIKKIIEEEDKQNPFSDQAIVEMLEKKEGIQIARRTVAKYREMLGILASSKRKKLF